MKLSKIANRDPEKLLRDSGFNSATAQRIVFTDNGCDDIEDRDGEYFWVGFKHGRGSRIITKNILSEICDIVNDTLFDGEAEVQDFWDTTDMFRIVKFTDNAKTVDENQNIKETAMKRINENQKVTLTIGQLKKLVKESNSDSYPPYNVWARNVMDDIIDELKKQEWFDSCDYEPGTTEQENDAEHCEAIVNVFDNGGSFKITVEAI